MLNFKEELKKFKPVLESKYIEEQIGSEDLVDLVDVLKGLNKEEPGEIYGKE